MEVRYSFNYIRNCNMCGSPAASHKVLGQRLNSSQKDQVKNKIGISTSVARCTECGLIYSNPQPVPFSIQDHYGIPPESYWNEDYFEVKADYLLDDIENIKSLLNFKGNEKSLEIGAGLGHAVIALSNAGFDSYGIEPSESFYKRAIEKMLLDKDKLRMTSVEESVFPENHFDLIIIRAVLEHVYDPSATITKALKWLKPQGIIWIEVPSSNWLIGKLVNIYYRIRNSSYITNLSPMHAPFHLYEFDLRSFQKHAKKNNYEIAMRKFYVCQTYLPEFLNPFLKSFMKWTNTGMQLSVWLRKK